MDVTERSTEGGQNERDADTSRPSQVSLDVDRVPNATVEVNPYRFDPDSIPAELRAENRWLIWRLEQRPGQDKPTKVPYQALDPQWHASSVDSHTWTSFENAVAAATELGYGIGFVLGDGWAGVDIDHMVQNGTPNDTAKLLVEKLSSYTETTPSGEGYHILVRGVPEFEGARKTYTDGSKLEVYSTSRYFTVTGSHTAGTPTVVEDRLPQLVDVMVDEFGDAAWPLKAQPTEKFTKSTEEEGDKDEEPSEDDAALLAHARTSLNGEKFRALYDEGDTSEYSDDESSADLALMNLLAFWTGKDEDRMERLFSASALGQREKWSREDYRRRTIKKACALTHKTYTPTAPPSPHSKPRYRGLDSVVDDEPPTWIVDEVIISDGITVLVGESGAGKTFAALQLAACISGKDNWCGRATKQGSVVYASWEGDAFGLRTRALKQEYPNVGNIYLLQMSALISPRVQRDTSELPSEGETELLDQLRYLRAELKANGKPPISAIFIDTVRASLAGNEDSSEVVAAYLRAIRRVQRENPGAAVVLVHHTGWQDGENKKKRERGSSTFRGNVEGTLYLEPTDRDESAVYLKLSVLKVRDAAKTEYFGLKRKTVKVGVDSKGKILTSCVVIPDGRSEQDRQSEEQRRSEEQDRPMLVKLLQLVQGGKIHSQDELRVLLGRSTAVTRDLISLARGKGWLAHTRLREPFRLTPEGEAYLAGGQR